MSTGPSAEESALLQRALRAAGETKFLAVEPGARHDVGRLCLEAFGERPVRIVADPRTMSAAGSEVLEGLRRARVACDEPHVFGAKVRAEMPFVDALVEALGESDAVPVAVGSGTLNDLTKLAAHRLGRRYMVVATAASMDGYTASGASITERGSKQTFACPAPRAVAADLDVLARAPRGMNAWGYADLLAKAAAGADWILADVAGEEPIDPTGWDLVQTHLPTWVGAPGQVAEGEPGALRRLVVGLMMTGFAMQATGSSRPASGAEHQFSHLWDMQRHELQGEPVSHGFKVAIGTRASLDLYEFLLGHDLSRMDVDALSGSWPTLHHVEERIVELLGAGELADKALVETRAKHPGPDALRAQLARIRDGWPEIRSRLEVQLRPFADAEAMLRKAGCPTEPEQIGISRERLRRSYEEAAYIRRRYTVLDFAMRAGLLTPALEAIFEGGARGGFS